MPNRERAKQLICEIARQSEGGLGKTQLFKAFWLAHLYYSKSERGYLSDWPIVRMPNGPGIHRGNDLINELVADGYIAQSDEPVGPFTESRCQFAGKQIQENFSEEALGAIRAAVEYARQHSASSLSELSHEFSRSWNNSPNGAELDIYTDLIPDDVYETRREELLELKKDYEDLFK